MTDDTERARWASSILGNPLLDEAFATLRESYLMQLMACAPTDNEGRWRFTAALRGIATIRNHFQIVLQRGQITQAEALALAEREKVQGIFKRAVRGLFSDDVSSEQTIA